MLLLAFGCAAPDVPADSWEGCVRDDDPLGDPVYRDCAIVRTYGGHTDETHTDAEGRMTYWAYLNIEEWNREFDGACETRTAYTCSHFDGSPCGASLTTRECDGFGNPTVTTVEGTRLNGDTYASTTDTTYTYDGDGRALVTVSTERGSDDPPVTKTCTYSDWESPDTCVENPTSDEDPTDDWNEAWTYDADGNELAYDIDCMNPGYSESHLWERDDRGRTTWSTSYDTAMSERWSGTYAYRDGALDTVTWTQGGSGPFDTEYTYSAAE